MSELIGKIKQAETLLTQLPEGFMLIEQLGKTRIWGNKASLFELGLTLLKAGLTGVSQEIETGYGQRTYNVVIEVDNQGNDSC